MNPLTAVVENGRIEFAAPGNLVNGTRVRIWLDEDVTELSDDIPMSPAEIESTLAALERFAAEYPCQDGEDLSGCSHERKDWEKSVFEARADRLRRQWE